MSDSRTDILESAYSLFLCQGYHGTSMRQIARQAGIALGGIYNHFPNKEAIFTAVLDVYHPYQTILPALAQSPARSLETFLHQAAGQIEAALNERPEFMNLMLIELTEFDGRHLSDLYSRIAPQIYQVVQRFTEAPERLRPIPVPVMVRAFIGLLLSYALTEKTFGKHLPDAFGENFLENLVDVFLHGILQE